MRKSTILTVIIVLLALSFCFVSCKSNTDKQARAYRVWYSQSSLQWHRQTGTVFVEVNPMTNVGDTLSLDDTIYSYVITSIDTTKGGYHE